MKLPNSTNDTKYLIKAGILTGICVSFYLLYYFIMPALIDTVDFLIPIILPFILAGILAILIDPVIDVLSGRLKFARGWAVFLVLSVTFIGIVAVLVLISSRLIFELSKLSKSIPDIREYLSLFFVNELIQKVQIFYTNMELPPEALENIEEAVSGIATTLKGVVSVTIGKIIAFFASLPNILMVLLITIIATFFFSLDKSKIQKVIFKTLPKRWEPKVRSVYISLSRALVGYLRAQITLMTITAIVTAIGLYLLGIAYSLTVGLLTGFVDILPVLGPGAVFVPWIIWVLVLGKVKLAISLFVLYVIIIVIRQIIEPKIVAENIGIHPLATLAAVFIGLKVLGIIGMIVGPALIVVIRAIKKAEAL